MRVSLRHIDRYIDFELPSTDELVTKINRQLGKVDEVIDFGERYEGAVIVKVVTCERHPNADKLNVCMVDDGSDDAVQVVCGAPNVRAGMYTVWLKPGATVPATAEDSEPFVLGARELRGVMSNGMPASPKELGIGESHDGILEITDYDLADGSKLRAGASFAESFGLNDTVVDIENKMFTHRPDLFGQLGVAREIAGITGNQFKSPDWYVTEPRFAAGEDLGLTTFNESNGAAPRIMFLPMKDVTIKPSPLWLQCALVVLGSKPINNIVDATNYIMLLTAQPTHAYDYDKLRGGTIGARMAVQGEAVKLLNGRSYTLNEADIVIADGEGPVGLGGIMGGGDSEVSPSTKNVVLEVATFDMYAVRKSGMRHGLFTEALTRFNKGQSPLQNAYVLSHLSGLIQELSGAKLTGAVSDLRDESVRTNGTYAEDSFIVRPEFINARLGLGLDGERIADILNNVELRTQYDSADGLLDVNEPFWRTDIELAEDIVEEVGRLYGFDKLPRVLPTRSARPAPKNALRELKTKIRSSLSKAGANELLTYSFIHGDVLQAIGYDPDAAFKLSNAVSPELQYYRPMVLPSLLDKVHMNIKNGYDEFTLFEIGKAHSKTLDPNDEGLPVGIESVDLAYAARKAQDGAAFYRMRRQLDTLANDLGVTLGYEENTEPTLLFERSRSAIVYDVVSGHRVGIVGEFAQTVSKKFKLPQYSAGATLHLEVLHEAAPRDARTYRPLSKYPSVSRDISIKVAVGTQFAVVYSSILAAVTQHSGLDVDIRPTTIYAPEDDSSKTITVRLSVASHERTLNDTDIRPLVDAIANRVADDVSGVIV